MPLFLHCGVKHASQTFPLATFYVRVMLIFLRAEANYLEQGRMLKLGHNTERRYFVRRKKHGLI